MLTSGFCQRRRGCKSKNAGRNLRATAFDKSNQRPVNASGRDPNHCQNRCRNHLDYGSVPTILVTMMGAAMMTVGCVVVVAGPVRRLARCGGWLRVRWIGPGWEPV
jgi:hypothetical protein